MIPVFVSSLPENSPKNANVRVRNLETPLSYPLWVLVDNKENKIYSVGPSIINNVDYHNARANNLMPLRFTEIRNIFRHKKDGVSLIEFHESGVHKDKVRMIREVWGLVKLAEMYKLKHGEILFEVKPYMNEDPLWAISSYCRGFFNKKIFEPGKDIPPMREYPKEGNMYGDSGLMSILKDDFDAVSEEKAIKERLIGPRIN